MNAQPHPSIWLLILVCIVLAVIGMLLIIFPKQVNRFFNEANPLASFLSISNGDEWYSVLITRVIGICALSFIVLLINTAIVNR